MKAVALALLALTPVLTALLGPRADTDAAPPPTGNPAARGG